MSKKILLIEDNAEMRENTAEILQLAHYKVIAAMNGKEGVELAEKEEPDLIICDIMMPVLDGYGVLHMLAKNEKTASIPFIFLTAKAERTDFRKGMEMGADDYLVKPFAAPELVARLKALVRRSNPRPVDLQLGGLQLDPFARRATIDGLTIELSAREWAVLEYLMQHASRVVSKQQIIDAILPWGEEVTLNAVEVYISRIRAKIDKAGITIKTIRGFGYMLEQSAR